MKNQIKINRAVKNSNITPAGINHILSNIPGSVIDTLTSKQLADLMLGMDKHFKEGASQSMAELKQYIGLDKGTDIYTILDHEGANKFDDVDVFTTLKGREKKKEM